MYQYLKVLLFLSLILIIPTELLAGEQQFTVCTMKLPGKMVVNSEKGFLIDLFKATFKDTAKQKIRLLPVNRAFNLFLKKECNVLLTTQKGVMSGHVKYELLELPTGLVDYHTIVARSPKALNEFGKKPGQTLVTVRKWAKPETLGIEAKVQFAQNLESAIKMVKAKRADYFLGFNFLTRFFLEEKGITGLYLDKNVKISPKSVVIVVNPHALNISPENLSKEYKSEMIKLLQGDGYENLVKKYNVPAWIRMDKRHFMDLIEKI